MRRGLLLLLLGALLVGACSVPTDGEVRTIAQEDLPAALQDPPLVAPTTAAPVGQTVTLFFAQTDNPRLRTVERASGDGRLLATMRALLVSPATEEERSQNLVNLLASETQVPDVEPVVVRDVIVAQGPNGDLAEIYLSSNFPDLLSENLVRAHAQLVYTATAFFRVERVSLFIDGEPEPLSTEISGVIGVATKDDYPSFDPNAPELLLQIPTSTTEAGDG